MHRSLRNNKTVEENKPQWQAWAVSPSSCRSGLWTGPSRDRGLCPSVLGLRWGLEASEGFPQADGTPSRGLPTRLRLDSRGERPKGEPGGGTLSSLPHRAHRGFLRLCGGRSHVHRRKNPALPRGFLPQGCFQRAWWGGVPRTPAGLLVLLKGSLSLPRWPLNQVRYLGPHPPTSSQKRSVPPTPSGPLSATSLTLMFKGRARQTGPFKPALLPPGGHFRALPSSPRAPLARIGSRTLGFLSRTGRGLGTQGTWQVEDEDGRGLIPGEAVSGGPLRPCLSPPLGFSP